MKNVLCIALVTTGCVRGLAPHEVRSLVGSSAPLLPNPSIRLAIAGAVGERAAEIEFDVAAPMTFVTTGCVDDPALESAQPRFDTPLGAKEEVTPVTRLHGLRVGSVRLRSTPAGLKEGTRCVVVLGLDVLGELALQVNLATRRVAFLPSRPKAEWLALRTPNAEAHVLEVTRDPTHDWPLLAVRVHQEPEAMTTTFVFSTRESVSHVFDEAARAQGLKPAVELLRAQGLPVSEAVPPELATFTGYPYERLELAPGFGIGRGTLEVMPGAPPHGVAGSLAVDVWGRFDVTYDVKAGIVALRQPAMISTDARHVCGNAQTECFELHTEKTTEGLTVVATSWAPLEHGGRWSFDVTSPVSMPCRIGVTFSEGGRGRSAQHRYPWPRLSQEMPACAAALEQATDVKLGLFEEGPLLECPGVCGFVQDLQSHRVSCECQPKSGGPGSEGERRFFELYRKWLGPELPADDLEPADPE
jgi:hypothetical protein